MARKRGFTLVELMVVLSASAVVIAAAATMYAFIMERLSADAGEAAMGMQADSLDKELQRVLQISTNAQIVVVGGTNCLKCSIPSGGTDKNMDGVVDNAIPSSVDSSGNNTYTANQYVWFYMGDGSGNPSSAGTQLWRAVIAAVGTNPSSANKDSAWSLVNGNPRFYLLESFTATVNSGASTAAVTTTFSSLTRADRVGTSETMSNDVKRISTSRTYFWGDPR